MPSSPPAPDPAPDLPLQDMTRFALRDGAEGWVLHLLVEGIKCASCAFRIEGVLNEEPDVEARVNLTTRRLALRWKGDAARGNALLRKATAQGYRFMPFDPATLESADRKEERLLLRCLTVSGFASGNIMLLSVALWSSSAATMGAATRDLMHWVSALIAIPTMVYAGRPFFTSAWHALRHRRTNMDVPISVALVLTTAMSLFEILRHGEHSYFDSVVMLLFLLLIGRYLDRRTRGRVRTAAQDLLAMMAGTATTLENGVARLIPIRELRSGMVLQVAAGEKIAADGVIETGVSEVDPGFITGETLTQPVAPGTRVFGGMVNVMAPLTVRLTATGGDSVLGEVIRLMEKAEQGHALYVRLADRVARAYTPVVHALALVTFLGWWAGAGLAWQPALMIAMTVLIITCPCAMGLAVPAVQVLTSGRLFRRGMLLKSADAMERLASVDTVVFDKTGTLTLGRPQLLNPEALTGEIKDIAAALAATSRHPLARAVGSALGPAPAMALTVQEIPGSGLETTLPDGRAARMGRRDWCGDENGPADDCAELWLRVGAAAPVRLAFADALRPDATEVIAELRRRGLGLHLLSGDRESVVARVAGALGIADFRARLSPVDKAAVIEALRQAGRRVLMVGDGLNDAPALAAADVSLSPSSALDIAQNAADIVFQGEKLAPVTEAMTLSRRAQALVRQNFALAFLYNALAVPLAMAGFVTPLVAAVAMAGSSLVVVLNAQRLNRSPS